jgi:hypothetical protein
MIYWSILIVLMAIEFAEKNKDNHAEATGLRSSKEQRHMIALEEEETHQ